VDTIGDYPEAGGKFVRKVNKTRRDLDASLGFLIVGAGMIVSYALESLWFTPSSPTADSSQVFALVGRIGFLFLGIGGICALINWFLLRRLTKRLTRGPDGSDLSGLSAIRGAR